MAFDTATTNKLLVSNALQQSKDEQIQAELSEKIQTLECLLGELGARHQKLGELKEDRARLHSQRKEFDVKMDTMYAIGCALFAKAKEMEAKDYEEDQICNAFSSTFVAQQKALCEDHKRVEGIQKVLKIWAEDRVTLQMRAEQLMKSNCAVWMSKELATDQEDRLSLLPNLQKEEEQIRVMEMEVSQGQTFLRNIVCPTLHIAEMENASVLGLKMQAQTKEILEEKLLVDSHDLDQLQHRLSEMEIEEAALLKRNSDCVFDTRVQLWEANRRLEIATMVNEDYQQNQHQIEEQKRITNAAISSLQGAQKAVAVVMEHSRTLEQQLEQRFGRLYSAALDEEANQRSSIADEEAVEWSTMLLWDEEVRKRDAIALQYAERLATLHELELAQRAGAHERAQISEMIQKERAALEKEIQKRRDQEKVWRKENERLLRIQMQTVRDLQKMNGAMQHEESAEPRSANRPPGADAVSDVHKGKAAEAPNKANAPSATAAAVRYVPNASVKETAVVSTPKPTATVVTQTPKYVAQPTQKVPQPTTSGTSAPATCITQAPASDSNNNKRPRDSSPYDFSPPEGKAVKARKRPPSLSSMSQTKSTASASSSPVPSVPMSPPPARPPPPSFTINEFASRPKMTIPVPLADPLTVRSTAFSPGGLRTFKNTVTRREVFHFPAPSTSQN